MAAEKQCGGHAVRKGQNPNIVTRLVQQSHLMEGKAFEQAILVMGRSPAVSFRHQRSPLAGGTHSIARPGKQRRDSRRYHIKHNIPPAQGVSASGLASARRRYHPSFRLHVL